jgi:hypothetical protein
MRTTRERISSAQDSANLGESPIDELADIDIIRACGMVGAKFPLGVSLWRLKYSGDSREFRSSLDGLVLLFERRWPGNTDALDIVDTVVAVLKHWLDDVCHACHGRGYEMVPGAPVLSEKQCGVCNGEGRVKLPRTDEPAQWLLEQIARMEREVAGAIMRKLAADMEL